jgi:gas vesicle protein
MNSLIRAILKTAVYFLDQTDRVASDVSDRVSGHAHRAANRVSDQISDLRDRANDLYPQQDHTLRNVIALAAGVGVGVAAGMLLAPASGEELRDSIGDKVSDIGDRVRTRFSSEVRKATGTDSGL